MFFSNFLFISMYIFLNFSDIQYLDINYIFAILIDTSQFYSNCCNYSFVVESNKDISVRLGTMWKNLDADSKETYYSAARKADEEHKVKYPGYYYSPKEARLQKGLRQRRPFPGASQMDAVRFVKVFMTNAEKNALSASASLLRKLQTEPKVENTDSSQDQIPPESTVTMPPDIDNTTKNNENEQSAIVVNNS